MHSEQSECYTKTQTVSPKRKRTMQNMHNATLAMGLYGYYCYNYCFKLSVDGGCNVTNYPSDRKWILPKREKQMKERIERDT